MTDILIGVAAAVAWGATAAAAAACRRAGNLVLLGATTVVGLTFLAVGAVFDDTWGSVWLIAGITSSLLVTLFSDMTWGRVRRRDGSA